MIVKLKAVEAVHLSKLYAARDSHIGAIDRIDGEVERVMRAAMEREGATWNGKAWQLEEQPDGDVVLREVEDEPQHSAKPD